MKFNIQQLIASGLALTVAFALPSLAHAQDEPEKAQAVENQPESADEPSIDDLLGIDEDPADDEPDADEPAGDKPDDPDTDPELTRDLDKALTGKQAADQFSQAIEEMEEVAIRLGEESDPGIDTQRMQDEIILKLEQIIASAEKVKSQQKPQPGQGQPQQQQARQADKQQGQQPGEQQGQQQGQQPGEQQGQQPGDQQAQQPGDQQGDQQGQGEQQGDQQGQQQAQQPGGSRAVRTAAAARSATKSCR